MKRNAGSQVPVPRWPYRGPGPHQTGAPTSDKSYCPACDTVGRGNVTCQGCGEPMTQMPRSWRPGKKGSRTRLWDHRQMWHSYGQAVPEAVKSLGVPDPQPVRTAHWWRLNADQAAIEARGIRQRARRRRNRRTS